MTSAHHLSITPDPPSDADANSETEDEGSNESRYLGQNSIAAFLSEEARAGEPSVGGDQDVIKKDIMPILGLQISTSPYPFMSPDDMDKIRQHIASVLPPNREVLKYVSHSVWPSSTSSGPNEVCTTGPFNYLSKSCSRSGAYSLILKNSRQSYVHTLKTERRLSNALKLAKAYLPHG